MQKRPADIKRSAAGPRPLADTSCTWCGDVLLEDAFVEVDALAFCNEECRGALRAAKARAQHEAHGQCLCVDCLG